MVYSRFRVDANIEKFMKFLTVSLYLSQSQIPWTTKMTDIDRFHRGINPNLLCSNVLQREEIIEHLHDEE